MDTTKQQENARAADAARVRADDLGVERAAAEAQTHAESEAREGERKLSPADIAAIEEDTLRRRYMFPQKDPTSTPLQALSANEPARPTMDEILADTKFPAMKADLVLRARNHGTVDDRYAMERIEDRMYMDAEDVQRALRAA